MKDMNEVLNKIISEYTGISEVEITDDAYLLSDLNIESIMFVDLVLLIEEKTSKKIDFTEFAVNLFEINDMSYSKLKLKDFKKAISCYF